MCIRDRHRDVPEVLDVVEYVAAPPIRIAPEVARNSTRVFYAPVDDFELSITDLTGDDERVVRGWGPRILVVLDGRVRATTRDGDEELGPGEAVFVPANDGAVTLRGTGTVVQADVP